MDYRELQGKSKEEARKLVAATREELRTVRFRIRHGEEKDVRRSRELRRAIARILTFLRETGKTDMPVTGN